MSMPDGDSTLTDKHYDDWTSGFLGVDIDALRKKSAAASIGGAGLLPGLPPSLTSGLTGPALNAPSTATAAPIVDEAWIVGFLTRHRFGPPDDANAPEGACLFDRAASTVDDVVKALDEDATRNGLRLNANEADIVKDVLEQRRRGASMGAMTAKHMQAGDDIALFLAGLQKQKMVSMLDALQAIRGAKQLDPLLDMTRNDLHDPRLEVAILSVQQHLGGEWQQLYDKLTDDADKTAIRTYVFQRIEDGDAGDKAPIKHGSTGYQNDSADDAGWIAGFLTFVHARPDPSGDGSGDTCEFNGIPMPFQRAIDTIVEQAALAGRMIGQDAVRGPLAKLVVPPPKSKVGGADAPQYNIAYALQPKLPQAGGPASPAQTQISFTGTIALHADGKPGLEYAWTVQIARTANGFILQNIATGPQLQWVEPFLNNTLQIQVLASALAGGANTGNEVKGSMALVPTAQLSVGGQVTYVIPGTGKHVLIGFQLAGQVTATEGQGTTAALVPQGIIQITF